MYDVIIVGGGPAGLSAALVLGRSRRKVLVCDTGRPRNAKAEAMHGYLTRDGINPLDFLQAGREELKNYNVLIESREIIEIKPGSESFEVTDTGGEKLLAKKILIATGIVDMIPDIQGIDELYGKSVHHCPYCDGWEVRDKRLAVCAKGKAAYMLSYSLKTWSDDVILCTNGFTYMRSIDKEKLKEGGIRVMTGRIRQLEGKKGMLQKIIFENGDSIERDAMFFSSGQFQRSGLAGQLGCRFSNNGYIRTTRKQQTNINGVFVAGDVSKDIKFVVVAAAEGAKAAVAINISLQEVERKKITDDIVA